MDDQNLLLSWIERVVNKGPFPKAETNFISRLLNIILLSCILPAIGFVYIEIRQIQFIRIEIIQPFSSEAIIIWVSAFLFSYTFLVYYASQRVRGFPQKIRNCLDYDENEFLIFKRKMTRDIFRPPVFLLILLLLTVPLGVLGVSSSPLYTGDMAVSVLFSLILSYCCFLHWIASWMLFKFLSDSSKFGTSIPLKINAFDPDRVGGLAPLADLSTLAISAVGLLSVIAIPAWYIFFNISAYTMMIITSFLIPCYFFYSMRGVYESLRGEKEKALTELNDELQRVSAEILDFIKLNHQKEHLDEGKLIMLGQTLNSVNIIHDRIRSMHAFPVNSEIMIKVILSAILPIFGVVADFIIAIYF